MIDVTALKAAVSLLDLAQLDTALRRVAGTAGGEWHGPCPKCGGADRFRVQPDGGPDRLGWAACRQCWPKGGDLIGYVMWRDGCDFRAACERLGGPTRGAASAGRPRPPLQAHKAPTAPPGDSWQAAARQFVDGCAAALWATHGELAEGAARARAWLAGRGLDDDTLRAWKIGYNSRETWADRAAWGLPQEANPATGKPRRVWLPRGVVIPCEIGGRLWYLKFRRVPGEAFTCLSCRKSVTAPGTCPHCQHDNPKYPASHGTPALFLADSLKGHRAAVLVEGEFDALLLWQEAGDLAGVATLGSAGKDLDLTAWAAHLLPVSPLILAYDADESGERGAAKLTRLTARAKRAKVPALRPGDKDLTDLHAAGGNLRAWLKFELAKHGARPGMSADIRHLASTPAPTGPAVAEVMADLSPIGYRLPETESQARPLSADVASTPPPPDDDPGLWAAIMAEAPADDDDGGPWAPSAENSGLLALRTALKGDTAQDVPALPAGASASTPAASVSLADLLATQDHPSGQPEWPCWACGADAWRSHPADVGGGYFCAVCHPLPVPEAVPA